MRGDTHMIEDEEDERKDLNNDEPHINRGVELLLRNRRTTERPKTFQVKFSFFSREVTLSLDIKKK